MIISVVGQGYVGLPFSVAAAKAGHFVNGLDLNLELVHKLNSGFTMLGMEVEDEVRGHFRF
jgi:UDP-N-acetyl-D-mannosaminuronate dehydrogenase